MMTFKNVILDTIFLGMKENKQKDYFIDRYLFTFAAIVTILLTFHVFGAVLLCSLT